MNVVICGCTGSGKSTAIKRILSTLGEPVYGFWTEKLAPDESGSAAVYLHGCREPLCYRHRIGLCINRHATGYPEVFEDSGVRFLSDIPKGALVLMDEIGVMENRATAFREAVFAILDGDYRVLVAVRDRSTPLLDAIRHHPKSRNLTAQEANGAYLSEAIRLLERQD